jgi:hypothetical protein
MKQNKFQKTKHLTSNEQLEKRKTKNTKQKKKKKQKKTTHIFLMIYGSV